MLFFYFYLILHFYLRLYQPHSYFSLRSVMVNKLLSLTNVREFDSCWLFGFYGMSTFVGYFTPNSVYIYILNNSPYVKKPGKWFKDENIQRITVKGKNIYILEKKKRPTLSYQLKKIERHAIGWSKEKNTVRAAKLQCKKCSILSWAI